MDEDAIFKALSVPIRRVILNELAERADQTLFELCARLTMKHNTNMSRQAITKHLNILEKAALIRTEFRGKYRVLNLDKRPITYIMERWGKGLV